MDLSSHIQDFIDSCVPKLRSQWPEVRGSAAIVIGSYKKIYIYLLFFKTFNFRNFAQFPHRAKWTNRGSWHQNSHLTKG